MTKRFPTQPGTQQKIALGACVPARFLAHPALEGLSFAEITIGDARSVGATRCGTPIEAFRRLIPDQVSVFSSARETLEEQIEIMSSQARRLRARKLTFGSGPARSLPTSPTQTTWRRWRWFLETAREAANEVGAEFLLEPLSPRESNNVTCLREALGHLQFVDGLTLDIEHVGQDPFLNELLYEYPHVVRHVHLSGPARRAPQKDDWPNIEGFLCQILESGARPSISFEIPWNALVNSLRSSASHVRAIVESVL